MESSVIDIIGFAASGLVFFTFCMRTLLPLRLVAITSNVFFIAYGLFAGLMPILGLHLLLLPMNVWRMAEQLLTGRRMRQALLEEPNLNTLLPFMIAEDFADEDIIFNHGDGADRFYVVADGKVIVEKFGQTLTKCAIFGEMGFFSSDGKRTATVRALGPVKLSWIDRNTLVQVCQNKPDFALFLTRLMVTRLLQNGAAFQESR